MFTRNSVFLLFYFIRFQFGSVILARFEFFRAKFESFSVFFFSLISWDPLFFFFFFASNSKLPHNIIVHKTFLL